MGLFVGWNVRSDAPWDVRHSFSQNFTRRPVFVSSDGGESFEKFLIIFTIVHQCVRKPVWDARRDIVSRPETRVTVLPSHRPGGWGKLSQRPKRLQKPPPSMTTNTNLRPACDRRTSASPASPGPPTCQRC